jgi:hypothetical protein
MATCHPFRTFEYIYIRFRVTLFTKALSFLCFCDWARYFKVYYCLKFNIYISFIFIDPLKEMGPMRRTNILLELRQGKNAENIRFRF